MNSLSTMISVIALVVALLSVWYAVAAMKYMQQYNKSSVTLRELTKLQTELTEHADSIAHLHESLAKLRSRVGMRKLREKNKDNGDGLPDSKTDPEAWKAAMRLRIHNKRFNT